MIAHKQEELLSELWFYFHFKLWNLEQLLSKIQDLSWHILHTFSYLLFDCIKLVRHLFKELDKIDQQSIDEFQFVLFLLDLFFNRKGYLQKIHLKIRRLNLFLILEEIVFYKAVWVKEKFAIYFSKFQRTFTDIVIMEEFFCLSIFHLL